MKQYGIKSIILLLGMIVVFFVVPNKGLAVEFSIDKGKIDAYLLEDRNVHVEETFTYSFDGEFNGITREIISKEGTKISSLKAKENGKSLKVEREDGLYKIYRKGEDETITIVLTYTIQNGVDVYSDVAEFYWPFFDENNESTYENYIITIYPPEETSGVIAFGYDEAFDTEKINKNGTVQFHLGEVPSGENGDIRVAYDAKLFPSATIAANKSMKNEIVNDKKTLYDDVASAIEKKDFYSKVAMVVVPSFALIICFIMLMTWLRARVNRTAVRREAEQSAPFIPKQTMSLPATIVYTNGAYYPAETMAAAMMDLVRKRAVIQIDEKNFSLNDIRKPLLKHEEMLIEFLFKEIGRDGKFSFDDLASFTKIKKNHQKYQASQTKWLQAVKDELKHHELYENKKGYRWIVGLSSLILSPFLYLFPANDLFGWFAAALVLFITTILYALTYYPKTWLGLTVTEEWGMIKKRLKEVQLDEWSSLNEDEKMRVYIFAIGIKDKKFMNKSTKLTESFELPVQDAFYDNYPVNMASMVYFGSIASSSFHSANDTTQISTGGSGSSIGGGGSGVGGGGGGSGAF
ncbi:DUF2207 domain-containing protein [Bacillus sp. DNRA2]|uniref:DUF2207 domain-containing protein n=1 Tax=Bacillus sp. DNRA2 TaxID=2723053 RepID=UPI00145D5036|nr:DUF2207 domain-containing protein [Bacillus sp. DNRA2]NMD70998.1 DUF2207 domain-containing protein [Bacillus sp. DNRA2]